MARLEVPSGTAIGNSSRSNHLRHPDGRPALRFEPLGVSDRIASRARREIRPDPDQTTSNPSGSFHHRFLPATVSHLCLCPLFSALLQTSEHSLAAPHLPPPPTPARRQYFRRAPGAVSSARVNPESTRFPFQSRRSWQS